MKACVFFFIWLAALCCASQVRAEQDPQPRAEPPQAIAEEARRLIDDGQAQDAISRLKAAVSQDPDSTALNLLLARAYLVDGNNFWALRTLQRLAQAKPKDCEPSLWIAKIQLGQGLPDEAREILLDAVCAKNSPSAARRSLLLAQLDLHTEKPEEAREHLASARAAKQLHPEDHALLEQLIGALDPGYLTPISGKLDLMLGWAADARAGSPTDPVLDDSNPASPTGRMDLWLRFIVPSGRWLRPSLEAELRALSYSEQVGRDYSYLMLGARPGILLFDATPNLLMAYRFEALLLAGGDRYEDGPLWLNNAHRAEFEASLLPALTTFGGAGRRVFREIGRSRTEADLGLGGGVRISERLRLIAALTGRVHRAHRPAYHLWGGSAVLFAILRLPESWKLRAGVVTGVDWYPDSAGAFDPLAPDTNRRELLLKTSVTGLGPSMGGLQLGLSAEYSQRFSSIRAYDYQDMRVLFRMVWRFSANPWAPASTSNTDHIPLDHDIVNSGFEERLQDLLRQDEAAQRSSSCVE